MDKEEIKTFSIITLGECGVGKTAIIKRFVDGKFEDYETTIGVNYSYKKMLINKKDKIILRLVDTTGQEKFRALTKSYFKNADAVLFVFSLDNKDTFYTITDWMELFNNNNNREGSIPKYLVGTKNDLKINVEQKLIDKFVQKYNIPFKSTSAKKNALMNCLKKLEKNYI